MPKINDEQTRGPESSKGLKWMFTGGTRLLTFLTHSHILLWASKNGEFLIEDAGLEHLGFGDASQCEFCLRSKGKKGTLL